MLLVILLAVSLVIAILCVRLAGFQDRTLQIAATGLFWAAVSVALFWLVDAGAAYGLTQVAAESELARMLVAIRERLAWQEIVVRVAGAYAGGCFALVLLARWMWLAMKR